MKLVFIVTFSALTVAGPIYAADAVTIEMNKAFQMEERGDFHGSIRFITEAISKHPGEARLYSFRALSYLELKENDAALSDFEEALRLDPENIVALMGRGRLSLLREEYFSAATSFDRVLALRGEWRAYVGRSDARKGLGRHEEALSDMNIAFNLGKDDPAFSEARVKNLLRRAGLYEKLHQSAAASSDYQEALQIDPSSQEAKEGSSRTQKTPEIDLEAADVGPESEWEDAEPAQMPSQQLEIELCSQKEIQEIQTKAGFSRMDYSITNDLWEYYFGKDVTEMADEDFVRFEKAVRDCVNSGKINASTDNDGLISTISTAIEDSRLVRDAARKNPPQQTESLSIADKDALSFLAGYFSQYAIAEICSEAGVSFSTDDLTLLKSGISETIKIKRMSGRKEIEETWSEISRAANSRRDQLSQRDCTQAQEWFTFALPNIKLGKSSDFPF